MSYSGRVPTDDVEFSAGRYSGCHCTSVGPAYIIGDGKMARTVLSGPRTFSGVAPYGRAVARRRLWSSHLEDGAAGPAYCSLDPAELAECTASKGRVHYGRDSSAGKRRRHPLPN